MIKIMPDSQVQNILELLAIAGEFSTSALPLLGNKRTYQNTTYKLSSTHDVRGYHNEHLLTTKVLQTSGKGTSKTLRLYKGALPLLDYLHKAALVSYLTSFNNHRFSGDKAHILRNHRVAEAIALFMKAGFECRPYVLPELQLKTHMLTVIERPSFYIARYFKTLNMAELNKLAYTRIVGAVFYPGGCYAVYNARTAEMKWSGTGELRSRLCLDAIVRMNAGLTEVKSAMFISGSPQTAIATILDTSKEGIKDITLDQIFPYAHYIPMDNNGIRLVCLLTLPDWREQFQEVIFPPEMRIHGFGSMEYDAYSDGKYIFSHLDSDFNRHYFVCHWYHRSSVSRRCIRTAIHKLLCLAEKWLHER